MQQEQFLATILPENNTDFSRTNLSKLFKALHHLDSELFHGEEQDTPDMTVQVWGGRFFINSVYKEWSLDGNEEVTTTNSGAFTAPTGNPKIDLLYWDTTSETLGITPGAESATPVQPAIPDPALKIPVLLIYHRVGSTKILNNDDASNSYIMGRNVRPIYNIGGGASNTIDGISNPGGDIDFKSTDGTVDITPDDGGNDIDFSVTVLPSGTKILFKQSSAPTGWTIDDTITDKSAVRYTRSGTYGADAGSVDLETGVSKTQGHALTTAELATHNHNHSHNLTRDGSADPGSNGFHISGDLLSTQTTDSDATNAGSGNSHNHDIELRYTDVIVATKD